MIGHNEAFRHIYEGNHFKDAFVVVGDKLDWFAPEKQLDLNMPMIYTESRNPQKIDLAFLKGQRVHLIHGRNASDEFFYAWYTHALTLQTKCLVALDSEGDIYVQ